MRKALDVNVPVFTAAVALSFNPVSAGPPTAIFTDGRTGLPNSNVPNIENLGYDSATFIGFERPRLAAGGSTWIAAARANATVGGDSPTSVGIILVGDGLQATAVAAGGGPAPTGGGSLASSFDTGPRINSNGDLVFQESRPPEQTWRLFRFDASTNSWSIPLQQGDPVPGFPGQAFSPFTDIAGFTADKRIAVRTSDTTGPLPNGQNDFLVIGDTVIAQTGVTTPTPQIDAPPQPLQGDFFTLGNFDVTEDGNTFAYDANLDNVSSSRDRIFVVNGTVVFQEGAPVAGFATPGDSVRASGSYVAQDGTWAVNVDLHDNTDVIVVNGSAVAVTGDAVPRFPGEVFDDAETARTFGDPVVRSPDEYVFEAETDFPDDARDSVLIYAKNHVPQVLLRKDQRVDLDGDGITDDAIILGINGDLALIQDHVVFTVTLVQEDTTPLGEALVRLELPPCPDFPGCPFDLDGDGQTTSTDVPLLVHLAETGDASVDYDCTSELDFFDVLAYLDAREFGCP